VRWHRLGDPALDELKAGPYHLYGVIRRECGQGRSTGLTDKQLARIAHCCERTVRNRMVILESAGFVSRSHDETGRRTITDQVDLIGQPDPGKPRQGVAGPPAKNCRTPGKELPDPRQKIAGQFSYRSREEKNLERRQSPSGSGHPTPTTAVSDPRAQRPVPPQAMPGGHPEPPRPEVDRKGRVPRRSHHRLARALAGDWRYSLLERPVKAPVPPPQIPQPPAPALEHAIMEPKAEPPPQFSPAAEIAVLRKLVHSRPTTSSSPHGDPIRRMAVKRLAQLGVKEPIAPPTPEKPDEQTPPPPAAG
jgi:hypothetical protein